MQTIVFLTLFLGLVEGPQVVELAAAYETARVEVLLDGELRAVIDGGPPWRAPIDLGDELAPRRLEAVARDAAGEEVGRAEQWLNLPRARAEVTLLVDRTETGAVARVAWRALEHPRASGLALTFDGEPVPLEGALLSPVSVPLPAHAADVLHVVAAEVAFPDGSRARTDAAFGGPFGDEVSAELTGIAVEVDGQRRLRDVDQAGAWLRAGDEVHRPVALDAGAASLYAVLDAGAHRELELLGVQMARQLRLRTPRLPGDIRKGMHSIGRTPLRQTGMRPGDRLHLVRPQVEDAAAGILLFGISEPLDDSRGGSAWQLTYLRLPHEPERPQRLADATATAGMWATGSSRPRGVLLILGPGAADESFLDPPRVRRYFERLRVPLEVWYVDAGAIEEHGPAGAAAAREGEDAAARRSRHLAEARSRWGEVRNVVTAAEWIGAHARLRDELARQRILWIEGRHPPQAVTLQGAPEWLRLVGGGAAD
jgi:hypothetical protein